MNQNPDSEFHTVRGYQLQNRQEGGLTPALEDYLEMVCRLCMKDHYARVGKLSELLHVKPSSTSKMIFKLVDLGYVEYDRYDSIIPTEKGRKAGEYLLRRHEIVEAFLKLIGNANPLEEAELAEHSLSVSTVSKIQVLLEFFKEYPEIGKQYEAYKTKN